MFQAHIEAPARVARVVLEYGVEKQTCGTVTGKAFPPFTAGPAVDVSWTWEMRKSGSEPPGAHVWYRWHVTDGAGAESVSDRQTVLWLDSSHTWQSISRDKLTLHWYQGSQAFAQDLLGAAVDSLALLGRTTGVAPQQPMDLYIYDSTATMRGAVLYQPGWTGGLAFPTSDIVLIGIGPQQVDWGKRTEAHELTHLLVGQLAFSCLSTIPTWLNEGIAVYGEGGPEQASRDQLRKAIVQDNLLAVRALSGGFSEDPNKADLSYSESYSLVNYLVTQAGADRLVHLFGDLRDGATIEVGLQETYSYGLDGLEDRWRVAVGAKARRAAGVAPTATVAPTVVPTYPPVNGLAGASAQPPVSDSAAPAVAVPSATATTLPARAAAYPLGSARPNGVLLVAEIAVLLVLTLAGVFVVRWMAV